MDIRRFPLEILERILLHLDTQALAAIALADSYLANIVYSSQFLDQYCRTSLSCSWVTAADVCNACISVPYEFWFWAHTTIKVFIGFDNFLMKFFFYVPYFINYYLLAQMSNTQESQVWQFGKTKIAIFTSWKKYFLQ